MSQHVFGTALPDGRAVEVVLGWDPPLSSFFMMIMLDGEMAYSSLEEEDAFGKGIPFFRAKLAELGVTVPAELFDEVELDRRVGDGVRRETHR